MGNEDVGCSSSESDRPLKKAKYLWQVKGKQHLKSPPEAPDLCKGSCLGRFLDRTEAILDSCTTEESLENMEQQVPVSLVSPEPPHEDWYLHTWQARQIARGYIDNTINSVMESRGVAAPFDAEDFVEKCQQNGVVEDEGIMMAIQTHGLQSHGEEAQEEVGVGLLAVQAQTSEPPHDNGEQSTDILSGILNLAVLAAIEKKGLSNP